MIKQGDYVYCSVPFGGRPHLNSSELDYIGVVKGVFSDETCEVLFALKLTGRRSKETLKVISQREYEEIVCAAKALEAISLDDE
jgi:hypothetical protein